jgi:two-component system, LytTR family, sensor kinase
MVMRLSQLMHYMLYEGNQERVALNKEIEYLQNYVALEKIRYGEQLQLSFQVKGDTENCSVAPLLLLPFVENAFKHGLSRQLEDAWLRISLTVNDSEMAFQVENSLPLKAGIAATGTNATQGIGLQNVAKRLQLLYPDRHRLRLMDGAETYLATLTLFWKDQPETKAEAYEDQVLAGR